MALVWVFCHTTCIYNCLILWMHWGNLWLYKINLRSVSSETLTDSLYLHLIDFCFVFAMPILIQMVKHSVPWYWLCAVFETILDLTVVSSLSCTICLADVKMMYEKALTPPQPSPPPTPQPKRTKADWERDEREILEEKEGLDALRRRNIPKYFESEFGKAFLLTQVQLFKMLILYNV